MHATCAQVHSGAIKFQDWFYQNGMSGAIYVRQTGAWRLKPSEWGYKNSILYDQGSCS